MKILHIITRLIVGGAQENTLLTCEGLKVRGHEVTLLTGPSPGPEGTLMERARRGGYEVIVSPNLVRAPNAFRDWTAYREIRRLVRGMKPDVVHTHSSKAGVVGRAGAWREKNLKFEISDLKEQNSIPNSDSNQKSKIKNQKSLPLVVHTIHGLPFHPYQNFVANGAWKWAERWAGGRCDGIICVADAMTRQARAAGVGAGRGVDFFTTIYSAMEPETFLHPGVTRGEVRARLGIAESAYVFGTIARLQPLKGHDDLLATAGGLFAAVPDAHLLWVGDGVFRERFEKILREKGWETRVTLTGLVPPDQVPRLLPAMDVLVHPSYREGLARALPQALLAGVPVISYDCDGAGEVCIEGQTGFLVKTGDAAELCAAMVRMAGDRAGAVGMGARGREICRETFAATTMVTAIGALYERLLRGEK